MSHIKSYITFLNESYREIKKSNYKNKYEYDFANYALNERPLLWDESDIRNCSDMYGNKEVGTVYHGNRINSESLLHKLESIKKEIDSGRNPVINMSLKSSTPSKSEAESFALYVKSYDEMTTFRMVAAAVAQGSSGQYGSYILTLQPTAEQVVIANFGGGKYPKDSAETEAILNGDIIVTDIQLYYPLEKERYLEQFAALNPLQLCNEFYDRWFTSHKLPRPDSEYIIEILKKLKTTDEAIKFVIEITRRAYVFNNIQLNEFLSVPVLKGLINKVKVSDDGLLCFDFVDKKIGLHVVKGLSDYLSKLPKFKKELSAVRIKKLAIPYSINKDVKYVNGKLIRLSFGLDEHANQIMNALGLINKDTGKLPHHSILTDYNSKIKEIFDEIILDKTIKDYDYNELYTISQFIQMVSWDFKRHKSLIDMDYIKKVMMYIYSNFAHRYADEPDTFRSKINQFNDMLKNALEIMSMKS